MRWTPSSRSLIAVLLIFALAIPFAYFQPYDFRPQLSRILPVPDPIFEVDFDLAPTSGQVPERTEVPYQPLGEHELTSDGLLIVNPDGAHPIFQLIRDAEVAWKSKLARASKTLDEAVAEYERRYHRAPPLGFDKWWDYVTKYNIQLPDDYDEIFEDIEPFWGIDPTELARTQEEYETRVGLVTLQKTEGSSGFEVVRSTLQEERQHLMRTVNNILTLVREVEHDLPPLRLTISPFDNPSMLSDWQVLSMAREAAANKTTLTRDDLPEVTDAGWIHACPPNSPARLHQPTPSSPALPPSSKSFIVSHRDAMDPCAHPWLMNSHGQFLSHRMGPRPQRTLVPRFSLCSTLLHHDIRPPLPYGWDFESDLEDTEAHEYEAFEGDLQWEHKIDERLDWRGRITGMWAAPDTMWENGHRARLVTLVNALEGNVSVLRVPKNVDNGREVATPVGEPESVRLARVNPAWMDIAFTEGPIGCDENGGTCDEMEKLWEFRRRQGRQEEGRYKFILDVDGNGWSGRFKRLITSNALIFKATIYPEWYTSRIAPWVHYVPIQLSYTDLYDTMAFFRVHDELAERIAKAGQDWSRRFWRREDMTAYLYRLLLEYARVTSLERESMNYVG